jgi:hypothetical protein
VQQQTENKMKKPLLFISLFAILFAVACTSRTNNQQAVQPAAPAFDTSGLAAFQEWKFLNERAEAAEYMQQEQVVATAPVKRKTVTKKPAAPVVNNPAPVQEESNTVNESDNNDAGTASSETSNAAKEKKGISNAVKGTVIGAVSGAVLGAVIHKKNRVVGGVIGGVLGGGGGYVIGRKMDKKKEAEADAQSTVKTSDFAGF